MVGQPQSDWISRHRHPEFRDAQRPDVPGAFRRLHGSSVFQSAGAAHKSPPPRFPWLSDVYMRKKVRAVRIRRRILSRITATTGIFKKIGRTRSEDRDKEGRIETLLQHEAG